MHEEFSRLSEQLRTRLSPLAHIFVRSSSPASTLFFRFKEYLLVLFRFLYESHIPVFFIFSFYCFFFHAIVHVLWTECFQTFTIYYLILSFVSLTKSLSYLAEFRLFDSYGNSFDNFFNLSLYTRNVDISRTLNSYDLLGRSLLIQSTKNT